MEANVHVHPTTERRSLINTALQFVSVVEQDIWAPHYIHCMLLPTPLPVSWFFISTKVCVSPIREIFAPRKYSAIRFVSLRRLGASLKVWRITENKWWNIVWEHRHISSTRDNCNTLLVAHALGNNIRWPLAQTYNVHAHSGKQEPWECQVRFYYTTLLHAHTISTSLISPMSISVARVLSWASSKTITP